MVSTSLDAFERIGDIFDGETARSQFAIVEEAIVFTLPSTNVCGSFIGTGVIEDSERSWIGGMDNGAPSCLDIIIKLRFQGYGQRIETSRRAQTGCPAGSVIPCGCLGILLADVLDQERGHYSQYHAESIAM